MGPSSSLDIVSSRKQVKQGSIASDMREIVPANRSSLTSDRLHQGSTLKWSSNLTCIGKKSLISGSRNLEDVDEKASDPLTPCTSKKPKLLIAGPDQSKHYEKYHHFNNSVKKESLRFLENVCCQNPEEVLFGDEIITGKRTIELNIGKQKDTGSQTVPHNNDETKGSAFLIQVMIFDFLSAVQLTICHYILFIFGVDFSLCLVM